ncbi:SulP family inorganic anion transporter [Nitrosomonas halophila]|uniref:Sulfate permease, MFS superfamily n=1 Tax=Nitrosomonas halophila TaxID=44576 RepID=A0A1H3BTC9_9PROT|nr:SulP family inorganic anion transporter [Nitrosomonas halophila]SDX45046.1 Sulfate permease, MFS superfamily [Nitrosomonas halophila]
MSSRVNKKEQLSEDEKTPVVGSAAFQAKYAGRDIAAGIVTGTMAIPLSVGIAIMSDYPIKIGLATVAFATLVGWIFSWFRPGNYIGCPGIAAGLAPMLALGVATFGVENMAFCIFLTAIMQAVVWYFNWQRYLLVAIPVYLVEGLLAGVGLKIFLKFLEFTYEIPENLVSVDQFWNDARIEMAIISTVSMAGFLFLFSKFKDKQPAIPYFAIIIAGIIVSQFIHVPMLYVEDVELKLIAPIPQVDSFMVFVYMILFCAVLAVIDVIEQVMSNAALEKIDPLKRKCNTNNSLLAIWVANLGSSFFGGMTNLDGLAKSTTNRLAGAYTKFSIVFIGMVVAFFTFNAEYLEYLPKFAIACVMLLSGYKMIAGLIHVTHHGPYAMMLAIICGALVWKLGIFEGLLIAMAVHGLIHFLIYLNREKMATKQIIKRYIDNLRKNSGDVS